MQAECYNVVCIFSYLLTHNPVRHIISKGKLCDFSKTYLKWKPGGLCMVAILRAYALWDRALEFNIRSCAVSAKWFKFLNHMDVA